MAWHNLKALKNDMAKITRLEDDIDDRFIIRGSRPPPPRLDLDIDEEEYRQRFGENGCHLGNDDAMRPDLDGIKEFIKLLQPEENVDCISKETMSPVSKIMISKESPSNYKNWRQTMQSPNSNESRNENKSPSNHKNWRPISHETSKESHSNHKNLRLTETSQKSPDSCKENRSPAKVTATTKLNPDVPCFYPSFLKHQSTVEPVNTIESKNMDEVQDKMKHVDVPINNITQTTILETSDTNVQDVQDNAVPKADLETSDTNAKVDLAPSASNAEEKQVTEIADLLKKKIVEASKTQRKREKNVAMAALLRLKTSPRILSPVLTPCMNSPTKNRETASSTEEAEDSFDIPINNSFERISNSSSPKHLVLYTPEYFEKVTPANRNTPVTAEPAILESPKTPVTVEPTILEPEPIDETTESVEPIEESVQKVENWLKTESPKPKPKTLFLKPVMFKRKSSASPSPALESTEVKQVKPASVPSYVPSKYATELFNKYEENAKSKQVPEAPVDIFTKLEAELKKRDEEIKRKKEQQSLDTSTSGSCDADQSFSSNSSPDCERSS